MKREETEDLQPKIIDIKRLKSFVLNLPRDTILRDLIMEEQDKLSPAEFCYKLEIWLRLFRQLRSRGGQGGLPR